MDETSKTLKVFVFVMNLLVIGSAAGLLYSTMYNTELESLQKISLYILGVWGVIYIVIGALLAVNWYNFKTAMDLLIQEAKKDILDKISVKNILESEELKDSDKDNLRVLDKNTQILAGVKKETLVKRLLFLLQFVVNYGAIVVLVITGHPVIASMILAADLLVRCLLFLMKQTSKEVREVFKMDEQQE